MGQHAHVEGEKNMCVGVMQVKYSSIDVGFDKTDLTGGKVGSNGLTIVESHLVDIPVGPVISIPKMSNNNNRWKRHAGKDKKS